MDEDYVVQLNLQAAGLTIAQSIHISLDGSVEKLPGFNGYDEVSILFWDSISQGFGDLKSRIIKSTSPEHLVDVALHQLSSCSERLALLKYMVKEIEWLQKIDDSPHI